MPQVCCLQCKNSFYAKPHLLAKGRGKFCSLACYNHREPNVFCDLCGKHFYRSPSNQRMSKSGLQFCCRNHKDQAQQIARGFSQMHPSHYGNCHTKYRSVAFRNYPPICNHCGWDEYPDVLIVHHLDRDRSNNNPENLEILCSRCHDIEHFLAKDGKWGRSSKL